MFNDMDSSKYSIELEDNTMSEEMEGGYTITRSRTTRRIRKTWKGAFTFIPDSDKLLMEAFWTTTSGKALIFLWTNAEDGVQYQVRFKDKLVFKYVGHRAAKRWDCDFVFEQA